MKSTDPRLRVDPIRGWRTLVAPLRNGRPFDTELDPRTPGLDEATSDGCPFCPGGEDELADVLAESPPVASGDPWGSRTVRNRYPFVGPRPDADPGMAGWQEVLIDTPVHTADPEVQDRGVRRSAMAMWRARVAEARRRDADAEVHLFRNHGRAAGSSRRHPHAQLVQVRGATPARTAMLGRLAAADRCLLCDGLDGDECDAEGLQVARVDGWRVVALFAPLDPGHLRLVPTRHVGSFADLDDLELHALSDLLGPLTAATLRSVGTAAYSLIVHETDRRAGRGAHLHLELRPRVGRTAGFEQSSGLGVCSADPVETASRIRTALASPLT